MIKIDFFLVWNYSYLESVDNTRLHRHQKNDMQKTNTEPQTLEDYGYCFESKHIKNWMQLIFC